MLPVGRSPHVVKRSNCRLGSLGSYFFFLSLAWRTRLMTATTSVQNWKISSHVMFIAVTPSLCDWGQKKYITPEKIREGTAYRGTGSTGNSIAQDITNCKQKPGRVLWQCLDFPRLRVKPANRKLFSSFEKFINHVVQQKSNKDVGLSLINI